MSNINESFTKAQEKPILVKANIDQILKLSGSKATNNVDVSGWTFWDTVFPKGTSFEGWKMNGTKFIQCDLEYCDFTGAETAGIILDLSTIELGNDKAKGLDLSTAKSVNGLNPHSAIAALEKLDIPLRRREEPVPFVAKLS